MEGITIRLNDDIGIDAIYKAASKFIYPPKPDSLSVTDLVGPPQIKLLKLKHWDDIEENVSDRIWAIFGSAIHTILEKSGEEMIFSEKFMEIIFEGMKIRGVLDAVSKEGDVFVLHDYKVTSVWSYIHGFDATYECAMNVYRYMLKRTENIDCKIIEMMALFKDWKKRDAQNNEDYPPRPMERIPVNVWTDEEVEAYIRDRLLAHQEVTRCTDEERWAQPTKYAVMKEGNKRAIRVLDTLQEANDRMLAEKSNRKGKFYVDTRKGVYRRCEEYCPVRQFCPQNTD